MVKQMKKHCEITYKYGENDNKHEKLLINMVKMIKSSVKMIINVVKIKKKHGEIDEKHVP